MATDRIALGLALLFATSSALACSLEPTAAPKEGDEVARVRAEVERGLVEIAGARARSDSGESLKWAGRVDGWIRQVDPGVASRDPFFVRATLTLDYLYCENHLAAGRLADARGWAEHAVREGALALPPDDANRIQAVVQLALVRHRSAGNGAAETAALERALVPAAVAVGTALGRGDAKAALALAKAAYERAETSLELGDPDRVRAVLALADLYCAAAIGANDLALARSRADAARAVAVRLLPPGDAARVQALSRMGEVQLRLQDRGAALRLLDQAVAEAEGRPAENTRSRIAALFLAASIRIQNGDQDAEATAVALLADALQALLPGDPAAVEAQVFFSYHVWNKRRDAAQRAVWGGTPVEEAESRLRGELGRIDQALRAAGVDPAIASLGLLTLARFQWKNQRLGATDATLESLARSIEDPRVAPFLAADYWNLRGLVETSRAQYAQARRFHDEARTIHERAGLPQVAQSLNNLGQLLLRQGDYRAAREPLQRAAELFAREPALERDESRPFTLSNLGKALEAEGRYEEAEQLHREALAIAEAVGDKDAETLCRNNLGINLYARGKFPEARDVFRRVHDLVVQIFGRGHVRAAEVDVNLGWVALALNQPDEAEGRFRGALAIARLELGNDHPRTAEILSYLARMLAEKGQEAEARTLLTEAMDLRERYLGRTLRSSLSQRDQLAIVQELRVHPESSAWPGVLDTYLELGPRIGIPTEERYRRLLNWKGVVARFAPPRALDRRDPALRALLDRRRDLLRKLRDAALIKPGRGERRRYEEDLAALESEAEDVERQIRRRAGAPREEGVADSTPEMVLSVLPPRSALLDVIEIRRYRPREAGEAISQDRRSLAYLVRPDRPLSAIDLGDSATIEGAVATFVRALAAGDVDASASSARLSGLIRSPLRPHLDGVKVLIVAGDGLLYRLPLGALPGARPGTYWIEDLAFASIPTAQSLVARRLRPRSGAAGIVALGGVDYGSASAGPRRAVEWAPLNQTKSEAEAVVRLFRERHPSEPADLLSGTDADEGKLRALLPRRRFAHLATHGFFRGDSDSGGGFGTYGPRARLDSGIVLAGANGARVGDPNDHLLTSEEVAELDLGAQELIVLSACDSGLGHISAGQGIIGLFGALDRAGTAAVVSALWKVEDKATALLMESFYRHLWSGLGPMGPAQALRAAQREMIRGDGASSSGEPYSRPQFWAAFVVGGDPFPTPRPEPSK